jgi:ornithine cyclodeaminase
MLVLDEAETRAALPWPELIEAIAAMFRSGCAMPARHHHEMEMPDEENATLLLMPAWIPGRYVGVKTVCVFPGNARRSLPAIFGTYLLSSAATGEMLALMQAHGAVRPIRRYRVWGRNGEAAERVAEQARTLGLAAEAVTDLETAARRADILSCATLSSDPLIRGEWLKPGSHLDLVGAFKPGMRESDDEAIRRAAVFVDTRAGAMREAGDITQPLASGLLKESDIRAELAELAVGLHHGRSGREEITLFKSVGAALEDLAGAILAYQTTTDRK